MMFDQYQNAEAIKRVETLNKARLRVAYGYMLESEHGRWLLSSIIGRCKIYEPVSTPEEEGSRRAAIMIRNDIEDCGLLDKWQAAEREYAEYKENIKKMLEQTEVKEEEP